MNSEEEPIPLDDDMMAEDALELVGDDAGGDDGPGSGSGVSKIQSFGREKEHAGFETKRPANKTGAGATRVKTFHAKLRPDALEFLDDQINHWLDDHPEYEVKFATTTIGLLSGKLKEEALFVNLWV